MKNKKYVVDRKNIYVGRLILTKDAYETYDHSYIYPLNYNICRSILFTINPDKTSSDLLYESGNYPILNITDNKVVKDNIRLCNK